MTKKQTAFTALLTIVAFTATTRAQNAPNNNAPAQPPAQAFTTQAPAQGAAAPPVPLGVTLQRAGGSLARVELASAADPAVAGASSASYFAVPAPQPKLLKKHDLVSIVVRENSAFSSQGTTDLKHTQDLDAQIDSYVTMHLAQMRLIEMTPTTPLEMKESAVRDFKGDAAVNRTDSFTAQISAEVIDVKPNGTLVLRASEQIKTDEEEQTMTLLGTCRVEDISADNTVLSTQLFDLSLNKTHRGAVRDTTERGFVTRLLDSINPF